MNLYDHDGSAPLRVLVVDDSRDTAETLKRLLHVLGCECVAFDYAASAMKAAPAFHPDLLLVDLSMPGLDGYRLIQRWRLADNLQGAMIVAMSGYADGQHRQQAFDAGCDDFLVKPFGLDELKGLLEYVRVGLGEPPDLIDLE